MLDTSSAAPLSVREPAGRRLAAWACLALAYLVVRFTLTRFLDSFGAYAGYALELTDVLVAAALAGRAFLAAWRWPRRSSVMAIPAFLAGGLVFALARVLGFPVPFDLRGRETLFLLLVVAPILEELIFRFFLWRPIAWLARSEGVAWALTSLLFAYSHLHAIWFVPPMWWPFVVYQTAYTLLLGEACGYWVRREGSVLGAVVTHGAFNAGFYAGFLIVRG